MREEGFPMNTDHIDGDSWRTFALERVKHLSVLHESVHYPQHFSLEEYQQTDFRVMRGDTSSEDLIPSRSGPSRP